MVTVKGRDNEMATVKSQGISKLKDSSKVVSCSNFYRLQKQEYYHF
jgi:hypothetical protein